MNKFIYINVQLDASIKLKAKGLSKRSIVYRSCIGRPQFLLILFRCWWKGHTNTKNNTFLSSRGKQRHNHKKEFLPTIRKKLCSKTINLRGWGEENIYYYYYY